MQYIEFAQKEKASKVLMKVFAAVLKMHPTKPELWIFAAKHAVDENADMTEARSYMQRGLRFNKKSEQLWVEYAKLELIYIAKILARRRLLGIDGLGGGDSGQKRIGDGNGRDEEGDEAMISLPGLTAEDLDPSIVKDPSIAALALENIETNPALNGAIPLAVFDAATQEIPNDIDFIRQFFDLFASFTELPCLQSLVSHVAQAAYNNYPTSPMALFLYAMCPTVGLQLSDPAFPGALGMMIQRIGGLVGRAQPAAQFYQLFLSHLFTLFQNGELDPSLKKVLRVTITKYLKQAEAEGSLTEELFAQWLMFLESGCTARKEEPETLQDGL